MDPVEEQLHQERLARIAEAPSRRETITCAVAAALLVLTCIAIAAVRPPVEPDWALLGGLVVIYAVFWQIEFEVGPVSSTPSQVVLVPMWFVVSPALLPLAVAAAQTVAVLLSAAMARERHAFRRAATNGPFAWFAVGPAVVLAAANVDGVSFDLFGIYVIALVAQFITDTTSSWARLAASGQSPAPLRSLTWLWMVDAALAPIGVLVAVGLTQSPWAMVSVLPLGLILAQFAKERDERILHAVELSSAYRGTAQLMGDVLEADDAYTGGEHTRGVVGLALALGQAVNLGPRQLRDLEFGALLHDIGKLRVPNEIINKPGKLTEEEWAIIKEHPEHGQEMLDRVGGELSRAGVIVRAHHERWDGGGYPDGLEGEEIPIEARIITICDSFSAMTTDRAYRKGMSHEEAVIELQRCAGSQFDPNLVAALTSDLAEPEHPRPTLVTVDAESPLSTEAAPRAA